MEYSKNTYNNAVNEFKPSLVQYCETFQTLVKLQSYATRQLNLPDADEMTWNGHSNQS